MACVAALVALVSLAQSPGPAVPIEPCESVMVAQVRASIEELRAAEGAYGPRAIAAVYEGTVSVEAHMMRPGMVRTTPVRVEIVDDPQVKGLVVRESSGPEASRRTETMLVLGGRIAEQGDAGAAFKEMAGDAAAADMADAQAWAPWTVVREALEARAACRPGVAIEASGQKWTPITFVDAAHRACSVLLDGGHRVCRVERLEADQRLGDVCHWTSFGDWERHEGMEIPRRVVRFQVQKSVTVRYELTLKEVRVGGVAREAFLLPESHRGDIPTWGSTPPPAEGVEFVSIGEHVWSAELAAANSRVLVIERDKDLVTLGAPDGDAVCETLVAALGEKFPGKPIGVAAFGHHHPSPSGGLRAMAATGATLVLPRGLENYARWMLGRRVDLGSPAVAGPLEPRMELFEGEYTIECGQERVRLIDIGEKSSHAFRYVVFFLPGAGVLFEDDLGYFPKNGGARAGPRMIGMADVLEGLKVRPRRLVQAWPVRDVVREVDWGEVEALVKAGREPRRGE